MIITEYELRANWHKSKEKIISVPPGSVITPAARDFLRDKGIRVQIEGDGIMDLQKANYSSPLQSMISDDRESTSWVNHMRPAHEPVSQGNSREITHLYASPRMQTTADQPENLAQSKPEQMTHLYGGHLVSKNHPVIALRGQLDLFQCELAEAELFFQERGKQELVNQMEEIAAFARQLMVAEVRKKPFKMDTLIGYSSDELREVSQHPDKYLGVKHTYLSISQGPIALRLHRLRAKAREVELYANKAFTDQVGNCSRTDLVTALNRLSSAFYILACKARANHESGVDNTS